MFTKKPKIIAQSSVRRRSDRLPEGRPRTFTYYTRRSDERVNTGRQILRNETAQQARAASRYWQQRFGLGVLLLSGIACLIYVSTLSAVPRIVINSAVPSKAVLQDTSVYQNAAMQIMGESILNKNKITVSTSQISAKLEQKFPELADVQASLPLLTHRVTFSLVSAQPVMILATSTGSYALDSNGTALLTGAQLSNLSELGLPLVTDESALKIQLRQQALTSSNVTFISVISAQLAAKHLAVSSMTLPAGASELDVRLTGDPYFVKFNLASNSALQQVGTLIAVHDRLNSQHLAPAEYIDVRVDGRAYYK